VLREDTFWHPARWDHFERVFARYRNADLSQADPKVAAGIADIVKWRRRNRQAINRLLPQTHWPRDLKHLEERLDTIQDRLGDGRRAFRNLHRLNCVLKLMTMELRSEAGVTAWARPAREPPRPRGQAAAASPARRRGAHPVSGAADGRGALRAERYVTRAVSQPRFAQTSSVAAALFIV